VTLRIHHLNCATMCPTGERLIHGSGGLLSAGRMVCHCLLIESPDGLVLVDTGLGLGPVQAPDALLGSTFLLMARPRLDPEETARRQIERLGYHADDVRHIVLTHLDLDHAGGIADFPKAAIHVLESEHEAAMAPATTFERHRYQGAMWAHQPNWVRHAVQGERWMGFESVQTIGSDILLVPLFGHSRGHCGVAVQTEGGWLLHAGDAYFAHGEVHSPTRQCPLGLDLFQRLMQVDGKARLANQDRLRQLGRDAAPTVRIICSHDHGEFEACLN
jgi:glyoxylase-like metal-dependent hydrolase (beta-lactamase superfamily II)